MRLTPAAAAARAKPLAAEAPRRRDVALVEPFAAGHAVDEVVGDIDAGQGLRKAGRPQHVAGRHLDVRQPVAPLESRRVADQAAHAMAGREKARHQPAAHVAGGAGDEDQALMGRPRRRDGSACVHQSLLRPPAVAMDEWNA